LEFRDHRRRQLDAAHRNALTKQRYRDAAGADPELERWSRPGQVGQERDGGIEQWWFEELRPQRSVTTRDPLVEVSLGHGGKSRCGPALRASDIRRPMR
jgi:hypothetical protein